MDVFSFYKAGLKRLLHRLGQDHPHYLDALTLQARLLENISQVDRHGDTQDLRSERSKIIESLNKLSIEALGTSFNKLYIAPVEDRPAPSWEPTAGLDQIAHTPSRALVERLGTVEAILVEYLKQIIDQPGFDGSPSLGMPKPDSAPLPPVVYAPREDLVRKLCDDLTNIVWLALVDGPGKGKTQLARAITEASSAQYVWWISLRGYEDRTANLHFEQQMGRWLVELSTEEYLWDLYASGWLNLKVVADLVSERVGSHGILVVDNLPDPLQDEELFRNLETVATAFAVNGTKLLTTGQRELPPVHKIDQGIVSTVGPPSFSAHDISQMLDSAGAPAKMRKDGILSLILGATEGHPTLVAATVHWLKSHQWQMRREELTSLLQGDPVEKVREYERRRVLHLLDERPKRLLYRLSLLWGEFDKALALTIAAVPPSIQYAGECVDNLIGPWIDRIEEDQLEVTPLLRNAGRHNLSEDEQKDVHRTVTQHFFAKHVINASQAHTVAAHLWAAGEYQTFVAFAIRLLFSATTPTQARHIEWATWVIPPSIQWPSELALDQKIMLRAAQVRTRALAGRNITELDTLLKRLMAEAGPDNSEALVLAYLSTGPFLLDAVPAHISLQRAIKAAQLFRAKPFIPEERLHSKIEDIIWLSASQLKGSEQVCQFLHEIRQMTQEEQERLFESDLATETSSQLIDSIWMVEADKPQEQQDWNSVLKVLDQLQVIGSLSGAAALQLAQVRARAVVLADYLEQMDDALSVLQAAPDTADPNLSFLLEYTTGCLLFDRGRFEEAYACLDLAASAHGESFSYYRLDVKRRIAIIKSKMGEWSDAKRRCIEVIQVIQRRFDYLIYDQVEMIGELAWIHWASGDREKACAALYGSVTGLVGKGEATAPRFREAFSKTIHGLGWFIAMAVYGQPPPTTITGEPYAPVEAGLFGIRRKQLGDYVPPLGFSKSLLASQLGYLAAGVGLSRMAWKTYGLTASLAEESDKGIPFEFAKVKFAPLAARFGDLHEAISLGLQATKVLAIVKKLQEDGQDTPDLSIDVQDVWESIPEEDRRSTQRQLLYLVFGPAFSDMLGSDLSENEIEERLTAWERTISEHQDMFEDPYFWERVIQVFKKLSLVRAGQSLCEEDLGFLEEEPILKAFWYLTRSSQPKVKLVDSLRLQLTILNFLLTPSDLSKHILPGVVSFLHRFWIETANTRGFALKSPQLFREELLVISPRKGAKAAVQFLRSASRAVGVSLPEEILEKFEQVEGSKAR